MIYPYKTRYFSFLLTTFFIALISISAVNAQDGEALFKANCTSCHAVKEKVIGPALKGISQRRSEDWLLKWVKNSSSLIKSGDEYAVKIFKDNNGVAMTSFNLKDEEIKAIFAYVKSEESKPDVVSGPVAGTESTPEKKTVWPWLLFAAVVLYLLSGVMRRVQETLVRAVREKEGIPEPPQISNKKRNREWIRQNKKLIAVILIIPTIVRIIRMTAINFLF